MNVDKIVEEAILGHASTRDAIRWAMKQAYIEGVASGITAEREACAKICDNYPWGIGLTEKQLAQAIRARGEK